MDCRTDESCNLKRNLWFRLHDVINTKEQTVTNSIKDAFEEENMQTQYIVLIYRIDLYFRKYKLAIEADELSHNDINIDYEVQRQKTLERKLNWVFIRINPDAIDLNIFTEINKIHRHIKKSSKKSLIDKISTRLLELQFVDNHSIKSKFLKWIVRKIHIYYKKCNKHTSNTYPKKIILISKNEIKGKSKCAICLAERTFIDKTEGDLERELEIYLRSFTD